MNKLMTICVAAVFMSLAVCTQTMALDPTELIAIREAADKALNAHDLDAMMSYWADDEVYDYVPLPESFVGKEAVRSFFEALFVGFPDFGTTEGLVLATNNTVVVEHSTTGTHKGEWMGIPPTGNPASAPHIDVYEFEGDKIKRTATYLDAASVMIQLGVLPAPEMPELVPSFILPDPEPTGLSPVEAAKEAQTRWNAHDLAKYAKMLHLEDDIFFASVGIPMNRDAYMAMQELFFLAFPDVQVNPIRFIDLGEGWVLCECTWTGTHNGPYFGIPPRGVSVTLRGVILYRYDEQGLERAIHVYFDNLTLMQQLTTYSFADYGSGTTIELAVGKGIWQLNWGQGPWTWSESTGEPLLDPNVTGLLDLHATAPADVSADLVATLPIAGKLTLSAHDARYKDVILGTMVLSGTGINAIDINASRLLVDTGCCMAYAPFPPPAPELSLTLDEVTGIFAYIDQVENCKLSLAGAYAAPLVAGLELQDNIFAALGGNIPIIGGIGTFALTGEYVPDMSKKVKSFCECGKGVALQLGAGGAVWDQTWGHGPYDWYECEASPDDSILGEDVVGLLETTTAGAPQIDENMILRFDFGGNFAFTDYNDTNPDEIAGQILGDVKGVFVADMNAANAVVDDAAGTITIVFGANLHDDADALFTVTQTTGTFENIHPIGVWEWIVSGTITCARVPTLSVQDNILAALQNNELLLGAEEEIVLSGSFYVSPPGE